MVVLSGCGLLSAAPPAPTPVVPTPTEVRPAEPLLVEEVVPTRPKPPSVLASTFAPSPVFGMAADGGDLGELEVRFIDVGQGDTTAILCPPSRADSTKRNVILIDVGGNGGSPAPPRELTGPKATNAQQVIDDVLANGPGGVVHALVLTHPDYDHYNGLGTVLGDIKVENLYFSKKLGDYKAKPAAAWLTAQVESNANLKSSKPDDIDCGSARVTLFEMDNAADRNSASIVVVINHGEADFVFTGDATRKTKRWLRDLEDASHIFESEVLKVSHHGGERQTLDEEWFGLVKPSVGVISALPKHRYGHPRQKVCAALFSSDILGSRQPHALSMYAGPKCEALIDQETGELFDDCAEDHWKHIETDRAVYNLGDIGNFTVTSDGETIETSYAAVPAEEVETRPKPEPSSAPPSSPEPTQLTDEEKAASCSKLCRKGFSPCGGTKRRDGKITISCARPESNTYKNCIRLNRPDRHIWEQCSE